MAKTTNLDYTALNQNTWNLKLDSHLASEFYDLDGFLQGNTSLNSIELDLLGDIQGKRILHLQCHFGQDSMSMARMGAHVTGVDLSNRSVAKAQELADQLELDCRFICCNVYDLPKHLDEEFDIVFTSYGTIVWLPDLDKWASIVSRFLKPGGSFFYVDFHPLVYTMDDDMKGIHYPYFNEGPIVEEEQGTYADESAPITSTSVTWNHPLSDIVTNLMRHDLSIQSLQEFDYSPYNCFRNLKEEEPGKYRMVHHGKKLPMVLALGTQKS
ncbi:MAG: class I SAM-dependent methyltransferase [Bacteroidia bacterium]|nr:class I SAM-dependent methyltransferase [Bacteroidia bacterium]